MLLKPCPFCGGEARLSDDWAGGQGHEHDHTVKCQTRGCRAIGPAITEGWEGTKEECQQKAADKWNARTASSANGGSGD